MKHRDSVSPSVRAACELLGVEMNASAGELKKAYHKRALLYHPDRNDAPGAAAEFRKVTAAFELLGDPLRIAELNRKSTHEKLHSQIVEGLPITFGSFFGYRLFQPAPLETTFQIEGKSRNQNQTPGREDPRFGESLDFGVIEENNSILDHPAFDALEVVYAGRHNEDDEAAVKGEVDGRKLNRLPWVILNNQGLLRFLDGDIKRSADCYRQLSERIPNNIIFMYRYGLCLILDGFRTRRRTLLGGLKPDRIKIAKGLALLERCIEIGESRKHGRQKCLVIRKLIADVQAALGQAGASKRTWKTIAAQDPSSIEAAFRSGEEKKVEALMKRRRAKVESQNDDRLILKLSGRAPSDLKKR